MGWSDKHKHMLEQQKMTQYVYSLITPLLQLLMNFTF